MNHKEWSFQALRYALVGIIATSIHYGVYYVLIAYLNVNIAYTIGYITSLIINFFLTAHFTFHVQSSINNGIRFLICHIINYGLHIVLLNIFIWLGLAKQYAPVPVFCIAIPTNFVLLKIILKKEGPK